MAVDEALLLDAADRGSSALRFYQWSEPTLSLGYFQKYDDREQHAASMECAVVRRQTGGGAILHDRELTYSIILPVSHPFSRHSESLYSLVHDAFIGVLTDSTSKAGKSLNLSRNKEVSTGVPASEPFLCFQRRAVGDVVATPAGAAANVKVLGSAQRRSRGALLQHGSLLLEKSPAAPELVGLRDLAGCGFSTAEIRSLVGRLEAALCLPFSPVDLPPDLQLKACEISNKKYGSAAWTKRR